MKMVKAFLLLSTAVLLEGQKVKVMNVSLDMSKDSFDDQYATCTKEMLQEVQNTILANELKKNIIFNGAWEEASKKDTKLVPGMVKEHGTALYVYTMGSVYRSFNTATKKQGKSLKEYKDKFNYKSLHFLLTDALRLLKEDDKHKCLQVYRGSRESFNIKKNTKVRFGHFTSTSMNAAQAKKFGEITFFKIKTCYGASVEKYSEKPEEEEVLVPPFEMFKVSSVEKKSPTEMEVELKQLGKCSNYQCAYFKSDWNPKNSTEPCDDSLATISL